MFAIAYRLIFLKIFSEFFCRSLPSDVKESAALQNFRFAASYAMLAQGIPSPIATMLTAASPSQS